VTLPEVSASARTLSAVLAASLVGAVGVGGALVLGAVRQIIAARYLGPEGFGILGIAESFENVLIRVAPLGLTVSVPLLLSRAVAEKRVDRAGRVVGTALAIGSVLLLGFGAMTFAFADVVGAALGTPEAGPLLRVWSVVIVGLGACQVGSSILRGLLNIPAATITRDVVPNALVLLGLVGAIMLGLTLPELGLAYAVGALVAAAIAIGWAGLSAARRNIAPRADPGMAGPLLAVTAPTLTMVIAGQLIRQVNVPILAATTDATTVGFFSAALFLATATEGIFTALTLVYMPYASRLLVEGGRDTLAAVQPAVGRWTYLVSLGPIATLFALAEPIITLLFGPEYLPGALPLRIVLIGILVRAVIGPRNSVQLAIGHGRDVSVNFLAALAAAVVVALVLTPTTGMTGSAISFAVGFVVRSVLSERQLAAALPGSAIQPRELMAAATILLFVPAAMLPGTPLTWLGPVTAGVATVVIFRVTRDETDDELIAMTRDRLRRRRSRGDQ